MNKKFKSNGFILLLKNNRRTVRKKRVKIIEEKNDPVDKMIDKMKNMEKDLSNIKNKIKFMMNQKLY